MRIDEAKVQEHLMTITAVLASEANDEKTVRTGIVALRAAALAIERYHGVTATDEEVEGVLSRIVVL